MNADKLTESIKHLAWRHDDDRRDLIADMRKLAAELVREADRMAASADHYPLERGVIQSNGVDVDRACALLREHRTQLELLKKIENGGAA